MHCPVTWQGLKGFQRERMEALLPKRNRNESYKKARSEGQRAVNVKHKGYQATRTWKEEGRERCQREVGKLCATPGWEPAFTSGSFQSLQYSNTAPL